MQLSNRPFSILGLLSLIVWATPKIPWFVIKFAIKVLTYRAKSDFQTHTSIIIYHIPCLNLIKHHDSDHETP